MRLYSAAEGPLTNRKQAMKREGRGSTHKKMRVKHFLFLIYPRWMRVGMWAWCVHFSTDLVHSSGLKSRFFSFVPRCFCLFSFTQSTNCLLLPKRPCNFEPISYLFHRKRTRRGGRKWSNKVQDFQVYSEVLHREHIFTSTLQTGLQCESVNGF